VTAPVDLAFTVRLPYAAAIRNGTKPIENRGRPPHGKYLGARVALHAAMTWSKTGAADPRIRTWWWGPDRADHPVDPVDFWPLVGRLIAVVTFAGWHQADRTTPFATCCQPWGDRMYNGSLDTVAWHIELADITPIDPPTSRIHGRLSVPFTLADPIADPR
jgi:hypothetical protein